MAGRPAGHSAEGPVRGPEITSGGHRGGVTGRVPGPAPAAPENRIALQVEDLPAAVEELRGQGAHFRNDIVTGVGVRQILIQDPSGNLVELFEPLAAYHERPPQAGG